MGEKLSTLEKENNETILKKKYKSFYWELENLERATSSNN
jgi:hypothetical protein